MAAVIKAANAKIRSNKVLDYVCSTRMCALSFETSPVELYQEDDENTSGQEEETEGKTGGNTEPTISDSRNRGKAGHAGANAYAMD